MGQTRTVAGGTSGNQAGQPDVEPGPSRDAGAGHDGQFLLADQQGRRFVVGHAGGQLKVTTRSGPDLGARQGQALAERLGQLQQQLVEGMARVSRWPKVLSVSSGATRSP